MNKIECEIIKDLLPNYVENLVSDKTKQAVDEHVKACKSCKEDLEILQEEKERKEGEEKEKQEEIEINHLKKYNKRLFISKIIAGTLSAVILITWGSFFIRRIKSKIAYNELYEKGIDAYNIIKEATDKLEELRTIENLEFIDEYINIMCFEGKITEYVNKRIRKFKDNKCRKEYYSKNYNPEKEEYTELKLGYINYAITEEDGTKIVQLNDSSGDIQNIEGEIKEYPLSKSAFHTISNDYGRTTGEWRHTAPFSLLNVIQCSLIETREEEYEGVKCYVLKLDSDTYTEEMWIEKESKLVRRYIKKRFDNKNPETEHRYTWSIGTVTDEEIFDGYTEEEVLKMFDELYGKYGWFE